MTVDRLTPALTSQTERVEKTKSIGKPDEKPKKNNMIDFLSKNNDKFFFIISN